MKRDTLPSAVREELERIYAEMEAEYNRVASAIGLSCSGCRDNCCRSYFRHHTYVEWAYLWHGLEQLEPDHLNTFLERAREYTEIARHRLERKEPPRIMCPLNDNGWCAVYSHRMMICRLHGVPNQVRLPDGRVKTFPGCHVSHELTRDMDRIPFLDRTPLYTRLAALENRFLGNRRKSLPKVDMTLAEMILEGPPFRGQKSEDGRQRTED